MGSLSAPINAKLRYNADTRQFYGDFMGGAEGDGVDLVGARAGQGFSLKLMRGSTQGRLAGLDGRQERDEGDDLSEGPELHSRDAGRRDGLHAEGSDHRVDRTLELRRGA